jgi:hypothetical protein
VDSSFYGGAGKISESSNQADSLFPLCFWCPAELGFHALRKDIRLNLNAGAVQALLSVTLRAFGTGLEASIFSFKEFDSITCSCNEFEEVTFSQYAD